jgi:sulfatase maturation enzyme AslB (radical SAM superfamily)
MRLRRKGEPLTEGNQMFVYMQATTGKLHRRKSCSITSRTRYDHFAVEFTPERAAQSERCAKCWDGFVPASDDAAAKRRVKAV